MRPSAHPPAPPPGVPPAAWEPLRTRRVSEGETLFRIAREEGMTVAFLLHANPELEPTRLRPGQRVVVPRVVHVDASTHGSPPVSESMRPRPPWPRVTAPSPSVRPSLRLPELDAHALGFAAFCVVLSAFATFAVAVAVRRARRAGAAQRAAATWRGFARTAADEWQLLAATAGEAAVKSDLALEAAAGVVSARLRSLGEKEAAAHALASRATGFVLGMTGATLFLHTPNLLGLVLYDPSQMTEVLDLGVKVLGVAVFTLCPLFYHAANLRNPADRARFRFAVVQSLGVGAAMWTWTAGSLRAHSVAKGGAPILAAPEWLHAATSSLLVAQACLWAAAYLVTPLAGVPDALDDVLPRRSSSLRWALCIFSASAILFCLLSATSLLARDAIHAVEQAVNVGVIRLDRALHPLQAPAEDALWAFLLALEDGTNLALVPLEATIAWAASGAPLSEGAEFVEHFFAKSLDALIGRTAGATISIEKVVESALASTSMAAADILDDATSAFPPLKALCLRLSEAVEDVVRLLDAWDPGILADYRARTVTLGEAIRESPVGRSWHYACASTFARVLAVRNAVFSPLRILFPWLFDPYSAGLLATLAAAVAYTVHCLSAANLED